MDEFQFRLNVEQGDMQENIVFTAKRMGDGDGYNIRWEIDGKHHITLYSNQEVKEILDKGGWIII